MYKKHIKNIIYIISIMTIMTMLVYYLKGIYPFGNNSLAWQDMSQVTIPLYYYWYDVLHGDALPFFTFKVANGVNTAGIVSEMSLYSPFNLFLYFCKREDISDFVSILLFLKMLGMAISMYYYSTKYKVEDSFKVLICILYGYCSCVLIHYQIGFMIDLAIFLPILIRGLYKLLEKGEYKVYILALALCLFVNIYISFMVAIYIILSVGLYFFIIGVKKEENQIPKLFVATIVALLLSSIGWLPALYCIMNSSRLIGTEQNVIGKYFNIIMSVNTDNFLINFFFINLSLHIALIVLYFLIKKIKNKFVEYNLIKTILMIASILVPGMELLWHGGSRASFPVRFAFIVAFSMSELSFCIMEQVEIKLFCKKNLAWIFGAGGAIGLFIFARSEIDYIAKSGNMLIYLTMCLEVVLIVGMVICLKKKRTAELLFLVFFEVIVNQYIWFRPELLVVDEQNEYINTADELKEYFASSTKNELIKTKDQDASMNSNYAFVADTSSLASYIHIIKGEIQTLLNRFGYSSVWTRTLDIGGTAFSDMIFAVEQIITKDKMNSDLYEEILAGDSYFVYRAKYDPPIIFEINENVEYISNRFDYQNNFFKRIDDSDRDLFENIEIGNSVNILNICGRKQVYFYSEGSRNIEISIDGKKKKVYDYLDYSNTSYPATFNNNIIFLGEFEDATIKLEFKTEQNDLRGMYIGLLDIKVFEEFLKKYSLNCNSIVKAQKNYVDIEWIKKNENYLFVPLFYDEGWKCKVNEKDRNMVVLSDGFMGIILDEGTNDIHLEYTPPYLKSAVVLSIIGVVLFGIFIFLNKNNVIKFRYIFIIDSLFYRVFYCFFVGFMIIFVGCPTIVYFYRIFKNIFQG